MIVKQAIRKYSHFKRKEYSMDNSESASRQDNQKNIFMVTSADSLRDTKALGTNAFFIQYLSFNSNSNVTALRSLITNNFQKHKQIYDIFNCNKLSFLLFNLNGFWRGKRERMGIIYLSVCITQASYTKRRKQQIIIQSHY